MNACGVRIYIPERKPNGRQNRAGKAEERQAVYANRRRVRGEYGKSLLRRRGEFCTSRCWPIEGAIMALPHT